MAQKLADCGVAAGGDSEVQIFDAATVGACWIQIHNRTASSGAVKFRDSVLTGTDQGVIEPGCDAVLHCDEDSVIYVQSVSKSIIDWWRADVG